MKTFKILFVAFGSLFVSSLALKAQDKNAEEIKNIIESKNYIFKAQYAYPQNGRSLYLTPDYNLIVNADTITSYLPYFGRAYVAPINPSDGGIKFTSTNFGYKLEKGKKSWEITIDPKDAGDVRQLSFSIFENGNAQLRIINTNR